MSGSAPLKPYGRLEHVSSKAPWGLVPRKRLEINFADFSRALMQCLIVPDSQRQKIIDDIEKLWGPGSSAVLSVRTGFDLLFQALRFPKGSEVICSAVTIKDMVKIVQHHGMTPIAVDLDMHTLEPDMNLLRKAFTPNTKMMVIAHVFGSRCNLDAIAEECSKRGVLLVEDCAEAFIGPSDYKGHPRSDVSLFSFGTIKTCTAFGGAIMRFRDAGLRRAVKDIEATYAARPRSFFAKRVLKYSALHSVSTPALMGVVAHAVRLFGTTHEELITNSIRGFPGDDLIRLIRQRPSTPLLALLRYRLQHFETDYLAARIERCQEGVDLLKTFKAVVVPGTAAMAHAYWLFPVMVEDPPGVCKRMLAKGYDVTQGTTQLGPVSRYVPSPTSLFMSLYPYNSERMMKLVVYLPVTPEMTSAELRTMLKHFKEAVLSTSSPSTIEKGLPAEASPSHAQGHAAALPAAKL